MRDQLVDEIGEYLGGAYGLDLCEDLADKAIRSLGRDGDIRTLRNRALDYLDS